MALRCVLIPINISTLYFGVYNDISCKNLFACCWFHVFVFMHLLRQVQNEHLLVLHIVLLAMCSYFLGFGEFAFEFIM